jgi:hypothetical protein
LEKIRMFIRDLVISRASVPSVGSNGTGGSVTFALERVAVAEKNLQAAREAARAAARKAGVDLAGLFSESAFVARSTAERWRDEARREGEKVMADIFCRNLDAESADEKSPFRHLARRLKRSGLPPLAETIAAVTGEGGKGAAILAAARRAKSDGSGERPLPAPNTVAGQILAAGARAKTPTGNHENDD